MKIKDGSNEVNVNRVDIEKLVGSASGSNGLNSNKCVLYDNNQDIYCKNLGIKVQNNVIFFRGRGQTASRSLWIEQLSSNANIILSELNQTLNGDKVFSRAITQTTQGAAGNHVITKSYVDTHNTNNNYLKTDGNNSMSGDLNMNNNKIINLKNFNSSSTAETDVPNMKYIKDNFLCNRMTSNLDFNNYKITNLRLPSNRQDAANKDYVDDEIKKASQKSSHPQENAFLYLMSDIDQTSTEYGLTVDGYVNYEQSFHSNKKVISFKANRNGSNYRYRIGFELGLIQVNKSYTIVIEQLFSNQTYWNKAEITINGTGISIHFIHTNKYEYVINNVNYYYVKTIVQLTKLIVPSNFLYYISHIDNILNSPSQLSLDLVVYGMQGLFHNVDESVYNEVLFEVVTDRIQPQKDIDMNNKNIINIGNINSNIIQSYSIR